jgi:outer membrane protein
MHFRKTFLRGFCLTLLFAAKVSLAESTQPETQKLVMDAAGKTLMDCFQAALKRSDTVGADQELVVQAEEKYKQAVSAVLPNISGSGQYFWQQNPNVGNFSPPNQPLVKLTMTQPLFQGFKEFAGLRQGRYGVDSAVQAKVAAGLTLFQSLTSTFYMIVQLETDLDNLATELDFYQQRIVELNQRIAIGRSQVSDRLTVESSMATIEATRDADLGQLKAAREMFRFYTGFDSGEKIIDTEPLPSALDSMDTYVAKVEERPDVKSAKRNVDVAHESIAIAASQHYPQVSFTGDYYFLRYGLQQNVSWDAMLMLTLPIFEGGLVQSQVSQARSVENQNDYQLGLTRKTADQQIRSFYVTVIYDMVQVKSLTKATQAAEKSFRELTRQYRLGLATNLDVLTALTTFQENQRSLDKMKLQAKNDFLQLESSAVKRPKFQ